MTTTLIVAALATPATGLLAAITGAIAEVHPIDYLRFQLGGDTSPGWAEGELTGEQPVARTGRHREETVRARLSNGADRLVDTGVISKAEIAALWAEEVA